MFFLIANHLLNDPWNAGIADRSFTDKSTITEDSDVVTNFHQFFKTMRYIDDGNATPLELLNHIEQHLYLRLAEG